MDKKNKIDAMKIIMLGIVIFLFTSCKQNDYEDESFYTDDIKVYATNYRQSSFGYRRNPGKSSPHSMHLLEPFCWLLVQVSYN